MINLIVALDKNNLIGKDNDLPWRLPRDLQYFKSRTLNSPIVMGRKTFQSLPGLLPDRQHVILTKSGYAVRTPRAESHSSVESVLEKFKGKDIYVIGGSEIFNLFLSYVDRMYVTYIDEEFEGDTYFPDVLDNWKMVSNEKGIKDDKNPYDYYFRVYEKK